MYIHVRMCTSGGRAPTGVRGVRIRASTTAYQVYVYACVRICACIRIHVTVEEQTYLTECIY
jgi:hypothetical protein